MIGSRGASASGCQDRSPRQTNPKAIRRFARPEVPIARTHGSAARHKRSAVARFGIAARFEIAARFGTRQPIPQPSRRVADNGCLQSPRLGKLTQPRSTHDERVGANRRGRVAVAAVDSSGPPEPKTASPSFPPMSHPPQLSGKQQCLIAKRAPTPWPSKIR